MKFAQKQAVSNKEEFMIYTNAFSNYPPINLLHEAKSIQEQKAIIETFKQFFPGAKEDDGVDFEDFFECAIQLHEAVKQGCRVVLLKTLEDAISDKEVFKKKIQDLVVNKGHVVTIGNGSFGFLMGTGAEESMVRPLSKSNLLGLNYPSLECLKNQYFGRKNKMCSFGTKDFPCDQQSIGDAVFEMYQSGVREFVAKITATMKHAVYQFSAPEGVSSKEELEAYWMEELGWSMVHHEGKKDAVHLSEKIDMQKEYRFVVMDGHAVTGAGCIEKFTPLNNEKSPYDYQVEGKRNQGNVHYLSNEEGEELFCFASEVIDKVSKESGCDSFVLDVARHNDHWVVIEVNPLSRFGMYALNAPALIEGYMEKEKEFCHDLKQSELSLVVP